MQNIYTIIEFLDADPTIIEVTHLAKKPSTFRCYNSAIPRRGMVMIDMSEEEVPDETVHGWFIQLGVARLIQFLPK